GRFNGPGKPPPLKGDEVQLDFNVEGARFDVVGDLPAVHDADGTVSVRGAFTTITLNNGRSTTPGGREIQIPGGTVTIPWGPQRRALSDLDLNLRGDAAAVTELVGFKPINGAKNLAFGPDDIKGDVKAHVLVTFPVTRNAPRGSLKWTAAAD